MHRQVDNIKICLKEIQYEGVDWIELPCSWRPLMISYEHSTELEITGFLDFVHCPVF
jgi:hypothetical protein